MTLSDTMYRIVERFDLRQHGPKIRRSIPVKDSKGVTNLIVEYSDLLRASMHISARC